jgi:16S rRNA (adenine1518-N6/adenine1519-N6)-dimethyltransferase
VLAFEIEQKLKEYWQENAPKNMELIWGNVLKEVENQKFIKSLKPYKVVANLPYQITSAVLRKFLEIDNHPQTMVLMVQKEVAERICAPAGEMSVLSVAVQMRSEAKILFKVPKSKFWPVPKVDSAVLFLSIKPKEKIDEKLFFNLVKAGFANRRKKLFNNLRCIFKNLSEKDFVDLGFDLNIRAQELSILDWKKLYNLSVKLR